MLSQFPSSPPSYPLPSFSDVPVISRFWFRCNYQHDSSLHFSDGIVTIIPFLLLLSSSIARVWVCLSYSVNSSPAKNPAFPPSPWYLSSSLAHLPPSYLCHPIISASLLHPSFSWISAASPPIATVYIVLVYLPPTVLIIPSSHPQPHSFCFAGSGRRLPPPQTTTSVTPYLWCCSLHCLLSPLPPFPSSCLSVNTILIVPHLFCRSLFLKSLPLPLSDIPIIPYLRHLRFHHPAPLLKSSSHSLPLSHAFHYCCGTGYMPCLLRLRVFHSRISNADILIKPYISFYTTTIP